MNYRNQWYGNEQNSQQLSLSFDKYFAGIRGGFGVVLNAKDYGFGKYGDYNLSLIYSPKIKLGRNVIFEPAVKLNMGLLNANGNQLAANSQIELNRGRILNTPSASQMQGAQQLWYKDYGLGFVVNAKRFYAGLSVDNLNQHYENVYNEEGFATPTSMPVMLNAIIGFDFDKNNRGGKKPFSASPFLAYQQLGNRKEAWAGVNVRWNWFTIGGSIAQTKDFTASAGIKKDKCKLTYHYDFTTSMFSNNQIGSHNLSLRFNGSMKKKRRINRIRG
jgi:type IX secretion system PorP/SprF family membrane protein